MAFKVGDTVVINDQGTLRKQDIFKLDYSPKRQGNHTAKGSANAYDLRVDLSQKTINYSITLGDSAFIHLGYPTNFKFGDGKAGIIAIHHNGTSEITYDSCWQFAGGGAIQDFSTSGRNYIDLTKASTKVTDAIAYVVVDSGEIYSSIVKGLGNPDYTW